MLRERPKRRREDDEEGQEESDEGERPPASAAGSSAAGDAPPPSKESLALEAVERTADAAFDTRPVGRHGENAGILSPADVAKQCVREAQALIFDEAIDFPRLDRLAAAFARASVEQMQALLLRNETHDASAFLTLSTSQLVCRVDGASREEALASLVAAAESEGGQMAIRDLMISFLMPRRAVGVRRTLLLDQRRSMRATAEFPAVVAIAHDAAMLGAEVLWRRGSPLRRACALLAGAAILTTPKDTDDVLRKSPAFGGRVQLPFLEVPPPGRGVGRVVLVPTTRCWVYHTLSSSGTPHVQLVQGGLEGLETALLALTRP